MSVDIAINSQNKRWSNRIRNDLIKTAPSLFGAGSGPVPELAVQANAKGMPAEWDAQS